MRFVADNEIPSRRRLEAVLKVLGAGKHVEPGDNTLLDLVTGQDVEVEPELIS